VRRDMSSDEDWRRLADAELTHDIVVARIEVRHLAKNSGWTVVAQRGPYFDEPGLDVIYESAPGRTVTEVVSTRR
jgi:hypothetical protein